MLLRALGSSVLEAGEPENRNVEYDAFSDAYATFLLTEILPAVRSRYAITDDADRWAIGGGSSGGSCAFTVAWMRPDRFRGVLSFVGSFAQLEGGNRYPELIRATPKKPRSRRRWPRREPRRSHPPRRAPLALAAPIG